MIGGTRPVFAEDVKPKTQPQQPNDEEYVIGQDDVITIVSPGHEELTQLAIVQPDGRITVAGMDGTIKAEGKTLLQLKREIFTGLDKLYNNLQLTVGLKEFNSRTVTMVGGRTGGRFRPRRKPGVFLRS